METDTFETIKNAQLDILVAEDDDLSFTITATLIERITGKVPDRAENGAIALDKVKKGTYDLVLMDHMMPNTNGIEATRLIRNEIQDWKQPIIVALSGSSTSADMLAFKNAGTDLFLAKPLRLATLTNTLLQVAQDGVETNANVLALN